MKTRNGKQVNGTTTGNAGTHKQVKTILIADDDPGIRDVYTIIFENAGFIVDLKIDGSDLMSDNFEVPDFFLIDKQLSGYSGLDVCRHLKSRADTKDIPLVIISAAPNIGSLSRQAGADGFIEKSFDLKDVLCTVIHFIGA